MVIKSLNIFRDVQLNIIEPADKSTWENEAF